MTGQETLEGEARALMAAQDWAAAAERWAQVRAQRPSHLQAHASGVEALIRSHRFSEAEALAAELDARFRGRPRAELFLAELTARHGRWAEAADRYDRVAAGSPDQAAHVMRNPVYRQAVLNAHGILEGSRRLDTVTHADIAGLAAPAPEDRDAAAAPEDRDYVFVSGMPRAGTTALGHLLNSRPEIVLFTELHNPYVAYAPQCFTPALVAARKERQPSVAQGNALQALPNAAFVGDKRPLFHYGLPHTAQAMAGRRMTVLHILRSPPHVAASYDARARNPADQWDPLRDLGNCIHELNVMHRFIADWHRAGAMPDGHRLVFVDYERVFRDLEYALGLFETIGVADPGSERLRGSVARFHEKSAAVLSRERPIDPRVRAALEAGLDRDAARDVTALTGIDVTGSS